MKKIVGFIVTFFAVCTIVMTTFSAKTAVPVKAAAPELNYSQVNLKKGQTTQVELNNLSAAEQKTVTYQTSKPSVATVSKSGKVKAVGAGQSVISVNYNKKVFTCKVTVSKDWSKYNGTYNKDYDTKVYGKEYNVVFKQLPNGINLIQIRYFGKNRRSNYITNVIDITLNSAGKATFNWEDNHHTKGTGTVKLSKGKITVRLNRKGASGSYPLVKGTLTISKSGPVSNWY